MTMLIEISVHEPEIISLAHFLTECGHVQKVQDQTRFISAGKISYVVLNTA